MRHQAFLALALVFALIGSIRTYSGNSNDNMSFLHVNIKNDGTSKLEGLKVKVFIYDLDAILQANPFDLGKHDKDGKFFLLNDKELRHGTYLARVTVSNDKVREVRHAYITI